jgi:hypothetical protein
MSDDVKVDNPLIKAVSFLIGSWLLAPLLSGYLVMLTYGAVSDDFGWKTFGFWTYVQVLYLVRLVYTAATARQQAKT